MADDTLQKDENPPLEPDFPEARFPNESSPEPWRRRVPGLVRTWWHGLRRELRVRGLLAPGALRLPDFLGIGAAKAGTTWLHANLARHPEILLPRAKEIHYFDTRWQMPVEWYASHFVDAGDRRVGEITPAYATLDDRRIRVVHGLMPHARLVLMVRDPVERAWSNVVMDFERFGGRSVETVGTEELLSVVLSPRIFDQGDYGTIVRRWTRRYPSASLLVVDYSEVSRCPADLFARCLRHLGVDDRVSPDDYPLRARVHAAAGPRPMPGAVREVLLERYRPLQAASRAAVGEFADGWSTA